MNPLTEVIQKTPYNDQISQETKELQQAFSSVKSNEPSVTTELSRIVKSINLYSETKDNQEIQYSLKSLSAFSTLS